MSHVFDLESKLAEANKAIATFAENLEKLERENAKLNEEMTARDEAHKKMFHELRKRAEELQARGGGAAGGAEHALWFAPPY